MKYLVSASTDIGIKKKTNQDSLMVKTLKTKLGNVCFAVLCDGMGGLEDGEVASASMVNAFHNWLMEDFKKICEYEFDESILENQWKHLINTMNYKISQYGVKENIKLGTTVVAILIVNEKYYIINVGDSRVYQIREQLEVLTHDQTVVGREVALGHMSYEESQVDPRRNILLQCVGASEVVEPEFCSGDVKADTVYMLCSDGFRHEISNEEIRQFLQPERLNEVTEMKKNTDYLVKLNKKRQETDNISVILIRTY